MSDNNEDIIERVRLFMEITGIEDRQLAYATLASLDYDLERAIHQHFTSEVRNDTTGGSDADDDDNEDDDYDDGLFSSQNSSSDDDSDRIFSPRARQPDAQPAIAEPPSVVDRMAAYIAQRFNRDHPIGQQHQVEQSRPQQSPRLQAIKDEDSDTNMDIRAVPAHMPRNAEVMDMVQQPQHDVPFVQKSDEEVREAVANFITTFDSRYRNGGITEKPKPNFFRGTLQEAVQMAFNVEEVQDRRPLAIYLHHNDGVAGTNFVSNILLSDQVSNLLRKQFITWPWDVTERENQLQLREWMISTSMEGIYEQFIKRHLRRNQFFFPMILLVIKEKGTLKIGSIVFGPDKLDTAMEKFMVVLDLYTQIRMAHIAEEAARKEREQLREEQRKEYEAALAVDRARLEAKEQEIREQKQAEEKRLLIEAQETFRRKNLELSLPTEPSDTEPNLLHIKVRLPEGKTIIRRFRRNEKLNVLLAFLDVQGFHPEKYKFFNSDFPKKDISTMDKNSTFEALKWPGREQLFVEEI